MSGGRDDSRSRGLRQRFGAFGMGVEVDERSSVLNRTIGLTVVLVR